MTDVYYSDCYLSRSQGLVLSQRPSTSSQAGSSVSTRPRWSDLRVPIEQEVDQSEKAG